MPSVDQIKHTKKISRYFLAEAPDTLYSFYLILFISFISGTLIRLVQPHSARIEFNLIMSLLSKGALGVLLFAIPAILAASLSPLLARSAYRQVTLRRSAFLSLMSLVAAELIYIPGIAISVLTRFRNAEFYLFIVAVTAVFTLRILIFRIFFIKSSAWSILPAGIQSLLMLACFIIVRSVEAFGTPEHLGDFSGIFLLSKITVSAIFLLLAVRALIWMIEAPIRTNFGISLMDLINYSLSNLESESKELEGIFEVVGETIITKIGVVALRAKGKSKAIIAAPFIHPGPFGTLGSSNLPAVLSTHLSAKYNCPAFFAKGAGTHDANLVSNHEMEKVKTAYERLMAGLEYGDKAAVWGVAGVPSLFGIASGRRACLVSTFAPDSTEDTDLGIGFNILSAAGRYIEPVYIEAHNAYTGISKYVTSGSEIGHMLISGVSRFSETLSRQRQARLLAGVGSVSVPLSTSHGMGSGGLGIMLFRLKGRQAALVFVDSNNMVSELREAIVESLQGRGIGLAEVVTSDTHTVNTVAGGENPLGMAYTEEVFAKVLAAVDEAYDQALGNIEPVEIGIGSADLPVRVLGAGSSTQIVSTINAVSAISTLLAPALILSAIILSIFTYSIARGFV